MLVEAYVVQKQNQNWPFITRTMALFTRSSSVLICGHRSDYEHHVRLPSE